ncbi:MAG: SsrA-binding protein SmpB [Phycisphaerae bacterium]
MTKPRSADRTVCRNRQAAFRYQLLDQIECGVVLTGPEVKGLRDGTASLNEAYALIERDELWLVGCHIGPYRHATTAEHRPVRRRKLLVHARELHRLRTKVQQKGLTLVPVTIHFNERGIAKVGLAIAAGKRQRDRREDIRARQHRRDMDRAARARS